MSSKKSRTAFGLLFHKHGEQAITAIGGFQERQNEIPISSDSAFEIGSASKMFIAVVILQLVEEGRLSLDQPIMELMNLGIDLPSNSRITVQDLLQHTSGIPDFFSSPEFLGNDAAYLAARTPQQLLEISFTLFETVEPAEHLWEYSNANYVILGLLIEQITKQSAETEIRSRILDPLGMSRTWYRPTEDERPPYAVGYYETEKNVFWDAWQGINPANYSWAGGYASTLSDIDRFMRTLVEGRLLTEESLGLMMTYIETPNDWQYGLGIIRREIGNHQWIGHGGTTLGTKCWVLFDIESGDTAIWYSTLSNDDFRSFEKNLFHLTELQ